MDIRRPQVAGVWCVTCASELRSLYVPNGPQRTTTDRKGPRRTTTDRIGLGLGLGLRWGCGLGLRTCYSPDRPANK